MNLILLEIIKGYKQKQKKKTKKKKNQYFKYKLLFNIINN